MILVWLKKIFQFLNLKFEYIVMTINQIIGSLQVHGEIKKEETRKN